ncbi:MAG TPA: Gfo/Idh/MocA family oxidoreductase [Planctomycetaceae bacterium]|jgi:predicted dehydrogenase|nr:Gfo/Idh/MocA family oxidoreductase [Planctomycetaceae bacterium]
MSQLRFGIVGTGMIAGVVADAIAKATNAQLTAVSSRRIENAQRFVAQRQAVAAVEGIAGLLARDVDAVYIATPTVAKEEIALAAIAAGKHVLVEKPFANQASLWRMTNACHSQGVAFMDATHFVHHPRTAAIRERSREQIGTPRSLNTTFYFPFSDRGNIRFDLQQEPMTALGDMAWYSMRAVVEYLRPAGGMTTVVTVPERDPQTSAVVRASGLIAFEGGEVSTFDIGYTAGTALMDLQLLGTTGVIGMDDFVLDWTDSFAFKNPDIQTGYSHRTGMATRKDATFLSTPANSAQEVLMIEAFADLAASGNRARRAAYADASLKTQEYLDAIWQAANT